MWRSLSIYMNRLEFIRLIWFKPMQHSTLILTVCSKCCNKIYYVFIITLNLHSFWWPPGGRYSGCKKNSSPNHVTTTHVMLTWLPFAMCNTHSDNVGLRLQSHKPTDQFTVIWEVSVVNGNISIPWLVAGGWL